MLVLLAVASFLQMVIPPVAVTELYQPYRECALAKGASSCGSERAKVLAGIEAYTDVERAELETDSVASEVLAKVPEAEKLKIIARRLQAYMDTLDEGLEGQSACQRRH